MASTTAHTPAEWTVEPSPNRLDLDLLIRSQDGGIVAKIFVRGDSPVGEANANIMAAAPELRAALEKLTAYAEDESSASSECAVCLGVENCEPGCALVLARAAIKKALGGAA